MSNRRRWIPPLVGFFGILWALLTGLSGCSKQAQDPRTLPPLVRTEVAGRAMDASRAFTGIVSARVQSDLGFRVGGKITERLVNAGQSVHRGEPLMRLDANDLTLQTNALNSLVAAAKAQVAQTAADERRYRILLKTGFVAQAAYDRVKASADSAEAQLNAAEAQAKVGGNAARYSVLLADADGVVVSTSAEPGQVVSAGQPVVRLARTGPREAAVDLPETIRPPIGSGALASVYGMSSSAPARLRQLSDAADPATRTFEARFVLEGSAASAPLGATVRISIPVSGRRDALTVPIAAIIDRGHGPGVWVVKGEDTRVFWHPVILAGIDDERATLTGGLDPGDRFVALGAHLLSEGERVRVGQSTVS